MTPDFDHHDLEAIQLNINTAVHAMAERIIALQTELDAARKELTTHKTNQIVPSS